MCKIGKFLRRLGNRKKLLLTIKKKRQLNVWGHGMRNEYLEILKLAKHIKEASEKANKQIYQSKMDDRAKKKTDLKGERSIVAKKKKKL